MSSVTRTFFFFFFLPSVGLLGIQSERVFGQEKTTFFILAYWSCLVREAQWNLKKKKKKKRKYTFSFYILTFFIF